MKGKEESAERMLNETEENQLSDIEFKTMLIGKLTELTENYQKLQGNYYEISANCINMKSRNRNYQQGTRGNEEHNF